MKEITKCFAGLAVLMLLVSNAGAVIWLNYQDGSAGREFAGWSVSGFDGMSNPPGLTWDEGGSFTFSADTTGNFNPYVALFSTDAFGGGDPLSIAEGTGLSMDFTGGTPSGLGFYFSSSADGGSVWFHDILGSPGEGRHSVSFASSGWYGFADNTWDDPPTGTFDNALAAVTGVGFFVYFNPDEDQTYGLNDFGLVVPEPETYMILGMALLSVAVVFRKRISDSLVEVRAMLQV